MTELEWVGNTSWWIGAGAIVTVLTTLSVWVFKLARWSGGVDSRFDTLTKGQNEMRADITELRANVRTDMDKLRTDVRTDMDQLRTDVRNDMDQLRNNIDQVRTDVRNDMDQIRADIKMILFYQSSPVQSGSPIQLNDFGRAISATGSAHEWAKIHAPNLEGDTAGKEEFEVFDLCVSYVQKHFTDDADFQRTVRATAYQHSTEPEKVLKVYQVELRDCLLAKVG